MLNSSWIVMVIAAVIAAAGYVVYVKVARRAAPREYAELYGELSADLAILRSNLGALLDELSALKGSPPAGSRPEWCSELEADVQEAIRWRAELPPENMSYAGLSALELDVSIIDVVAATVRVAGMRLKYEDELTADVGSPGEPERRYLEPAA